MDNEIYDLIIIGGGPSSLALAQCTANDNVKILIIERENEIGGAHRVRRVNYKNEKIFSEHGPRIYSETYTNFQILLKEMGIEFYDLFTKYNFNIIEIGNETVFSTMNISEFYYLSIEFIKLIINENYGKNINLQIFLNQKKFSNKSIDIIDRMCRLTDGGGSDKFTLNEFLELFNQQFFHSLYQPKLPNDKSLFKIWKLFLENKNVTFLLNTEVVKLNVFGNDIESVTTRNNNKIYGKKFVIATPPKNIYSILKQSNLQDTFTTNLDQYSIETAYIDYISITFHWDKKIELKKVYGFPRSYWGTAFIILSDYMKFEESISKTVISVAVTMSDSISERINKTANECNEDELINEIFNQLNDSFGNELPNYTLAVMSPGISKINGKYISKDTAFINSSNYTSLPFKSKSINNLYNVGTHNGKSLYKFTSLESAVSNAIVLSNEFNSKKRSLSQAISINYVTRCIIIVIIIYIIWKN